MADKVIILARWAAWSGNASLVTVPGGTNSSCTFSTDLLAFAAFIASLDHFWETSFPILGLV